MLTRSHKIHPGPRAAHHTSFLAHLAPLLTPLQRVSLDEVLYRVAGDGSHPPRLQPQANNTGRGRADFVAASAKPLLLSEVEESLKCVFVNP